MPVFLLCPVLYWALLPELQQKPESQAPASDRIITPAEVRLADSPDSVAFARGLSWPYRKFTSGMERGLIAVEKKKLRERLQDYMLRLRARGITPKLGGAGEGSGFGGGAQYDLRLGEYSNLRFLGLWTFKNYQEGGIQWHARMPHNTFFVEGSYLWRPQENFYGLGRNNWRTWRTSYALRQSWTGVRWEIAPYKRLLFGFVERWSWITATAGLNQALPPIMDRFPNLPGYNRETRLETSGAYIDMNGILEEYRLGGAAHLGFTYNRSFTGGKIEYIGMEAQAEGRTPVKVKNSVLVGLGGFQLNRTRGGSDPIPFFLQPHIGGSSTLRGYQLDRFYGPGVVFASLEYRIRVHPNIQFYPFFDEGQMFEHTEDLRWLDWHRNYGFGFRLRGRTGPLMTFEFGWGGEGTQFHLLFGTRELPPLRGPVRTGVYRR